MISKKSQNQLHTLLHSVIENYLSTGEPVWSKNLHDKKNIEYAPSTIRKYLSELEKQWLVYQPYNSSGRVPTVQWLSKYIDTILDKEDVPANPEFDQYIFDVNYARNSLKFAVEWLGGYIEWVVVWFLRNDEYYFIGINKLLQQTSINEFETTKGIVDYIETKKIIALLGKKIIKIKQIYYTFIEEEKNTISCLYTKVNINWYDSLICAIWPLRSNYKNNLSVLTKFIQSV
jgi:transcriptional regulator of heat shock response